MLGLHPNDERNPSDVELYLWQHPDSDFYYVKDMIPQEKLINPMETWGMPLQVLAEKVFKIIRNDYELLSALDIILGKSPSKRKPLMAIIKDLAKIT